LPPEIRIKQNKEFIVQEFEPDYKYPENWVWNNTKDPFWFNAKVNIIIRNDGEEEIYTIVLDKEGDRLAEDGQLKKIRQYKSKTR